MATPMSNSETPRHLVNGDRLARLAALGAGRDRARLDAPPTTADRAWLNEAEHDPSEEPILNGDHPLHEHASSDDELVLLRAENLELRESLSTTNGQIDEFRQLEEAWSERQKQYEALLEEKSEVIREQHRKLQESQRQMADRPKVDTPREEELLALHEDLEQERRQLKDDEETLMKQMRDMELQMSRERAELARQRNELQRLHTEIRHELELAARDATLRERLAPLQRRAQDALNRRGGAPAQNNPPPPPASLPPPTPGTPPPMSTVVPRKPADSGIFRRLFGGS